MEKTFEELMHEYTVKMDGITTYYLQPKTVLALMQKVREATIAECGIKTEWYFKIYPNVLSLDFENLPTDRINLE